MKDRVNKKLVKDLESEHINWIKGGETTHRNKAVQLLEEIKKREQAKIDAGFVLVKTPCSKGYSEKWVKREVAHV